MSICPSWPSNLVNFNALAFGLNRTSRHSLCHSSSTGGTHTCPIPSSHLCSAARNKRPRSCKNKTLQYGFAVHLSLLIELSPSSIKGRRHRHRNESLHEQIYKLSLRSHMQTGSNCTSASQEPTNTGTRWDSAFFPSIKSVHKTAVSLPANTPFSPPH